MTETDVVNGGLSALGEPGIDDLDADQQPVAVIARQIYATTRDALLRRVVWNFATKRAVWTTGNTPTAAAWGDGVLVPMAADCLRVLEVNGWAASSRGATFSIEGRSLIMASTATVAAPATTANVRYIWRVVDPDVWDAGFVRCMHYALAAEFAMRLTQSRSRLEEMRATLAKMLDEACAVDALENASWVIPADADDDSTGGRVFGDGQ